MDVFALNAPRRSVSAMIPLRQSIAPSQPTAQPGQGFLSNYLLIPPAPIWKVLRRSQKRRCERSSPQPCGPGDELSAVQPNWFGRNTRPRKVICPASGHFCLQSKYHKQNGLHQNSIIRMWGKEASGQAARSTRASVATVRSPVCGCVFFRSCCAIRSRTG